MEKWKIGVIVLLLVGLGGYGVIANRPPNTSAQEGQTPAPTPAPTGEMVHKKAIPWNIPADLWVNTPKPINLSDLKGHITLLEFWRSTCSHCQEAAPFMESLYKKYSPYGLKMVTFQSPGRANDPENPETDWNKVQAFVKDHKLTYPVAFDKDRALFNVYKGNLYPMVLILDQNGTVMWEQTGHDDQKARSMDEHLQMILRAAAKTNSSAASAASQPAASP